MRDYDEFFDTMAKKLGVEWLVDHGPPLTAYVVFMVFYLASVIVWAPCGLFCALFVPRRRW